MEHYALVKALHVAAVALTGFVFLLRALLVQLGRFPVAFAPPIRYASYAIDTVLLASALLLVAMLPPAVFANHWLHVKVALVVAYIVLGSFALKRARTRRGRAACLVAAIAAYAAIVGIAIAHHPLGWLQRLAA
ncbi:MAG: SirB2 family protein [Burkholderiales bacterium]